MALGLKLDTTLHDLVLVDGRLETVTGGAKLAQDIKTRLKINKGESLFDNQYGFPYFLIFESKRLNLSEIETIIKRYILETQGVKRISKFFLEYSGGENRKFEITFSVESTDNVKSEDIQVTI